MKRVLGIIFIVIAIVGVLLSIGGIIASQRAIEGIGDGLDQTLQLTADTLDNVQATLLLTKTTIDQVSDSLDTVGQTALNVSTTLSSTQPLLAQVTQVATGEIPDSLDSVQTAIPNVAEAAGAIDETLRILNSFKVDRKIFGIPIDFDLGINYQPEEPLDETVLVLGSSLDGIPDELRSMESNLEIANQNLAVIGQNLEVISGDMDQINATVAEIDPLLDEYIRLTAETSDLLRLTQSQIDSQLQLAQLAIMGLFIWLGINQIVPFYLGLALLKGEGSKQAPESKEVIEIGNEPRSGEGSEVSVQLESAEEPGPESSTEQTNEADA
jgi:methyl-accepting chemotaxis protein